MGSGTFRNLTQIVPFSYWSTGAPWPEPGLRGMSNLISRSSPVRQCGRALCPLRPVPGGKVGG